MNNHSFFDINRSKNLLIRQLCFNTNGLLIGFGAVAGILIFILSMSVIFGHVHMDKNSFFNSIMPTFFIMGYIFTSTIYSELRTPQRGYLFLMLPASTFEKLLVPWFITSVLYILASIFVMFVINILLMGIAMFFSGILVPLYNPFTLPVFKLYLIYLVTQPLFVLGAIYFRRFNFLKTILALFLFVLFLGIFTSLAGRVIIFHNFENISFDNNMPENVVRFFTDSLVPVVKLLFWACVAPFLLVVSYFRLKEREI